MPPNLRNSITKLTLIHTLKMSPPHLYRKSPKKTQNKKKICCVPFSCSYFLFYLLKKMYPFRTLSTYRKRIKTIECEIFYLCIQYSYLTYHNSYISVSHLIYYPFIPYWPSVIMTEAVFLTLGQSRSCHLKKIGLVAKGISRRYEVL